MLAFCDFVLWLICIASVLGCTYIVLRQFHLRTLKSKEEQKVINECEQRQIDEVAWLKKANDITSVKEFIDACIPSNVRLSKPVQGAKLLELDSTVLLLLPTPTSKNYFRELPGTFIVSTKGMYFLNLSPYDDMFLQFQDINYVRIGYTRIVVVSNAGKKYCYNAVHPDVCNCIAKMYDIAVTAESLRNSITDTSVLSSHREDIN